MRKKISKKEKEFADKLSEFENKWVAIERTKTSERIVASGDNILEAKKAAEAKGFKDPVFRKVPSANHISIG